MTEQNEPEPPESTLEGQEMDRSDLDRLKWGLEEACDYRGDVTVETSDGACFFGYIYDLRAGDPVPTVRMMKKEGGRATLEGERIQRLAFDGQDTAFGRSWEAWMRKYEKLKAEGRSTDRYPEHPVEE
jgi:hypothetical protein